MTDTNELKEHRQLIQSAVCDASVVKDFNKALGYIAKKKHAKAIPLFKNILKQNNFKEAWLNLGVAYKGVDDYEKVRDCFMKSVDPDIPLSDGVYLKHYNIGLSNLGLLAYTFEHDETAIKFYKTALENDPLDYDSIWNLSIATLRRFCSGKEEDLAAAWSYYSYRFKRKGAEGLQVDKEGLIPWDFKTSYPDDSIVLLIEQGLGDAFMFGRYLKELSTRFKKIYVQCTVDMFYVFQDYNPVQSIQDTDAKYAAPLGSLGKMLDYIPEGDWLKDKYIKKEPNDVLDIGVVWKGNPNHSNDKYRSVQPYYFDRLKKYANLHTIGPNPHRKGYQHLPAKDWEETIKNVLPKLDLIISIDSSIVHACGTLGMPCWVLMPKLDTDFRWGDSTAGWNNIWYKSVEVFRNPNNWDRVFDNVEKRLQLVLEEHAGSK